MSYDQKYDDSISQKGNIGNIGAYYNNIILLKKKILFNNFNESFNVIKQKLNNIISSNYFCKDFSKYEDPVKDEKESLTVIILDKNFIDIISTEAMGDITFDLDSIKKYINIIIDHIHSFYFIFQEKGLDGKEYLGTYNFCGDITKQGKGVIRKLISNENYKNIYDFFSELKILEDIFYVKNKDFFSYRKKLWKGLLIENPLFNSLAKTYINAGYIDDISIKSVTPNGVNINKPHLSMWSDPENNKSISERLSIAEENIKKLFDKTRYIIKKEDLEIINNISKYGIMEFSYQLSKKLLDNNMMQLDLITTKNPVQDSTIPYLTDKARFFNKVFIKDLYDRGEIVNNVSAIEIENTVLLSDKNDDLISDKNKLNPDICKSGDFFSEWHTHPITCLTKNMIGPYIFDEKNDIQINVLMTPSSGDLYIYSTNTNETNFVFSSNFIYSVSIRNELYKYKNFINSCLKNNIKIPISDTAFMYFIDYYISPYCGFIWNSYDIIIEHNKFIAISDNIMLNKNTFIYKAFIDNIFNSNIKNKIDDYLCETIKVKYIELFESFIRFYHSSGLPTIPLTISNFLQKLDELKTYTDILLIGPYTTHSENIRKRYSDIRISLINYDKSLFKHRICNSIYRQIHLLLYLFCLSVTPVSYDKIADDMTIFFEKSIGFIYKSFVESLTLDDLNIPDQLNSSQELKIRMSQNSDFKEYEDLSFLDDIKYIPLFNIGINHYETDKDLEIDTYNYMMTITNYHEYYFYQNNIKNLLCFDINLIKYYIIYNYGNIPQFNLIYNNGELTFIPIEDGIDLIKVFKILKKLNILHDINIGFNEIKFKIFKPGRDVISDYINFNKEIKTISMYTIEKITKIYKNILN